MDAQKRLEFKNITSDMPVIGFTGALGSGCSYLAAGLAKHHGYIARSLSDAIWDCAKQRGIEPTVKNLQDIGNELRQSSNNRGCLVTIALERVDEALPAPGSADRPVGIIIDSIRNVGEIQALQQLPNFFLISVQADFEIRRKRVLLGPDKRFSNEEEFLLADARDSGEHGEFGQQVKPCNDLSDIIINNNDNVNRKAAGPYKKYVRELIYTKYVSLIEEVTKGAPSYERMARMEEALMTAAYVESKRSSCLKRKVGAIIASPDGDIIAAGHNDVLVGSPPCISDNRYGWCARDIRQERIAIEIKHCPGCGEIIDLKTKCGRCKAEIDHFVKHCPKCEARVEDDYTCKCGRRVFNDYLAGAGGAGKLLDLCRALHAEENAILNLSRQGVRLPQPTSRKCATSESHEGYVLYSTTFPCNLCANKIVSIGIRKVVYAEPYPMEEARKVLSEHKIAVERFQGVKSRAFFRLYS